MPITFDLPIRSMTQEQFGAVAFEVVREAIAIHEQLGRFFDEHVYQHELTRRLGDRAGKEVFLHATFGDFHKAYRLDLLVDGGAIFEIKAVAELHDQHRSQLIHYLLMTGLQHGKLLNFRQDQLQQEFVNSSITQVARQEFDLRMQRWNPALPGCQKFQEVLIGCLRDWGTGLDLQLYEDAVIHFFGGPPAVNQEIDVIAHDLRLGSHSAKLINPSTAFKLTSLYRGHSTCETHLQRLLQHTSLQHILWVNITLHSVDFVVLSKDH